MAKSEPQDRSDLVAYWSVPLLDGVHIVEFEHGTATGKRVLRVDGKEILRKDWMFKLVGDIKFTITNHRCEIRVDPVPPFAFCYSLLVDGKPFHKFAEKQLESMKTWSVVENGKRFAVVFAKNTLEIWINGQSIEAQREFVEGGIEMVFEVEGASARIRSSTTKSQKELSYELFINNRLIIDDFNNNV